MNLKKIGLKKLSKKELNNINGGSELSEGFFRFWGYICKKAYEAGLNNNVANSAGIVYK